ncbi:transport and Golgi organization 2 homolog isoform X2 [Apostichopus japonicus]|uniref:transport and Golgi organization 2 homolog isoform X2 n=1 Tax=Stichopus japonicus TaxID=307972 RepID=UPI003AB6DDFB
MKTEKKDIGRDLQEDRVGGTWLGVSQSGRVAFLLNYFQLSGPDPEAKGRGSLVKDFILGDASPEAYTTLVSKEGSLYNPFNLICIEFRHSKCDAFYYSNKTGEHPTRIEPGVHGCSNSAFDKPWPKASHVKTKLNEVVSSTSEETEVIQKLFDVFHNDQRLDGEDSLQLDKASLKTNQELFSKILPNLIMVNTPVYGTRSTTVVLVKDNNEAIYVEKYLEEPIDPANYQWKTKEHRFTLRENLTLKL